MTYHKIKEELTALIYFLNGAIASERDPIINDLLFLLRARIQEIIGLNLETKIELHDDFKKVIKCRDGSSSIKLPKEQPFIFYDSEAIAVPVKKKSKTDIIIKREDEPTLEDILNDIDNSPARNRIRKCLRSNEIDNLEKLIETRSRIILQIPGLGRGSFERLTEALKNKGLSLK